MYKTVAETVKYVKEFRVLVKDVIGVEIVIAPPFTALHAAAEAARNSNVGVARRICTGSAKAPSRPRSARR